MTHGLRLALALLATLAAPSSALAAWPEQRTIATGVDDVVGGGSASAGLLAWHAGDAAPAVATVNKDGTVIAEQVAGLAPGDVVDGVAATDEGTAVLCLRRPRPGAGDPSIHDVLVAVRPAGGSFAAPRHVAAPSTEVSGLTCAVADDGDAILGWVEGDALAESRARVAVVGAVGAVGLRELTSDAESYVEVAMAPGGAAAATVYSRDLRDSSSLLVTERQPGGPLRPVRRIATVSPNADRPSVSVSPGRRTRVAWGDRRRVHRVERRAGRLVRRQVATRTAPWQAVFGWTPGGTLLTAWLDEPVEPDVSRRRVRAVYARPGRRERVLDLGLARGPGGPFAALAPDGSGAVAWEDETRLYARRLGRTGTPGHRTLLGPLADQTHPVVLAWSRGRSAIAWITRDGSLVIR